MSKASKASRSSEAWQIFKNYDCTSSNSFTTPSSTASRLRQSKRDDGGCGVWTHASLDSGVLNSLVLKTTALDHSAKPPEIIRFFVVVIYICLFSQQNQVMFILRRPWWTGQEKPGARVRKSQAVWRLGSTVAVWGLGVSSCTVRMPCVVGPPRLDIGAYKIIEACVFEACK